MDLIEYYNRPLHLKLDHMFRLRWDEDINSFEYTRVGATSYTDDLYFMYECEKGFFVSPIKYHDSLLNHWKHQITFHKSAADALKERVLILGELLNL